MDPFLSGDVPGASPLTSAWLRGLQHLEGNLERWATGMTAEGYWWTPAAGVNPVAALVRHIGGASTRLMHYAQGTMPSDELRDEGQHDFDLDDADGEVIYRLCRDRLSAVRNGILAFTPEDVTAVRLVGRKEIPVRTVLIMGHLLEHGHAHAAQVITMRKLYDARPDQGASDPRINAAL